MTLGSPTYINLMIYLLLIVYYSLLLDIAFIPKVNEVIIEQGLEETLIKSIQESKLKDEKSLPEDKKSDDEQSEDGMS